MKNVIYKYNMLLQLVMCRYANYILFFFEKQGF